MRKKGDNITLKNKLIVEIKTIKKIGIYGCEVISENSLGYVVGSRIIINEMEVENV